MPVLMLFSGYLTYAIAGWMIGDAVWAMATTDMTFHDVKFQLMEGGGFLAVRRALTAMAMRMG